MPTLSSLRLVNEIETRYVVTGEDQARRAMEGVAVAQDKMARGAEAVAVVTEQSARRQLNASALLDRERKRVDAEYRQTQMLEKASGTFDRALSQGLIDQRERDRLGGLAQTRYGGTNDNDPTRRGLSRYDKDFIKYQGFDVASSLGSGAGLGTVAFQQGPQILQQLADREGGLSAGLKQAGASAAALVTPFTVGATAVTALGVAFGVAASQAAKDREVLEASTRGMGGGTGATVSQLDAIARANGEAGKVSTSASREIVASYASLGSLSLPVINDLTRATADYAKITGQDAAAAAAELGRAVAEGGSALDGVAAKLGGLDDATRQLIRTQQEQGDRSGAQQTAADALKASVDANAVATTGWAAAWNTAAAAANGYWEAAKRIAGIKLGVAPEGAQEAVTRLQGLVDAANNQRAGLGLAPLTGKDSEYVRQLATARVILDQERMIAEGNAAEKRAKDASNAAGDLARQIDPGYAQLSEIDRKLSIARDGLADPLTRSKLDPTALDALERGYDGLVRARSTLVDVNGRLITSEERTRQQDQLTLDAKNATTDAEKARVAMRQKEFDLAGKILSNRSAADSIAAAGVLATAGEKTGGKDKAEAKDDYDRATRSLEDRIRRQGEEATTYGMGAEAVARYRTEQELLTAAKRADRDITPELTAQIQGYVDRSGEAAKRLEDIRDSSRRVDEYRTVGSDGVRTFVRGLSDGVTQGRLLENVMSSLKNRAADLASNSISDMLFGRRNGSDYGLLGSLFGGSNSANAPLAGAQGPTAQAGGLSGLFASAKSFFGFSEGGYTGGGARLQPAGIVHRGEYVFDQDSVRRMGVSNLDAMRRGLRGYDTGGYVGPSIGQMVEGQKAAASSASGPPNITFITPPGTNLEPEGPPQRRADGGYEQVLRHVEGGLGKRARNGQGPFGQAAGGAGFRIG